jgi:hypothetical protein
MGDGTFQTQGVRRMTTETNRALESHGMQMRLTTITLDLEGGTRISLMVCSQSVRLVETIHSMCHNEICNMLEPFETQTSIKMSEGSKLD